MELGISLSILDYFGNFGKRIQLFDEYHYQIPKIAQYRERYTKSLLQMNTCKEVIFAILYLISYIIIFSLLHMNIQCTPNEIILNLIFHINEKIPIAIIPFVHSGYSHGFKHGTCLREIEKK